MIIKVNGRKIDAASRHLVTVPPWSILHLYEGCDPDWLVGWERTIPAAGCGCVEGYHQILKSFAWDFESPEAFWRSGHDLHNRVNAKLDREETSIEHALTLWRHQRPQTSRTRCVVTIATGRAFRELLAVTGTLIASYAERNDADFVVLDNVTEPWWGFEKFRTRHFIGQYDEVLFLDADCLVHPDCENLFGRSKSVAIHDDFSYLARTDWISKERGVIGQTLGIEMLDPPTCFNTGVVYTRSDAAAVWSDPPRTLPITQTAEQVYAEQTVLRMDYEKLDSRYNWQFYFPGFWSKLGDARIAHLATSRDKLTHARQVLAAWGI